MIDNLIKFVYNISMKFYNTANLSFEDKVKVVENYLQKGESIRKVASSFGISHQTLWLWAKKYKKSGKESLRKIRWHKKRTPKDVETKIMFLKEQNPCLSIDKARQLMKKAGIQISNKGIWGIWKRYGLVNRGEQKKTDPFSVFTQPTPELEYEIERVKVFVERKDFRAAAKILNDLPSLPQCQFLKKMPEKLLTPRRRLECLLLNFGEIPFPQYLKKVRQTGKFLEREGYIYTSIIADFLELTALAWIKKPKEKLQVLNKLDKKMKGLKDSSFKFHFYFEQAVTYCDFLQVSNALKAINKCRKFVYILPYPYYWQVFADLLTQVGNYKSALTFYKMALDSQKDQKVIERLALKMAIFGYSMTGEYPATKRMLAKARELKDSVSFGSTYSLINAYISFSEGNLTKSSQFFLESLNKAYTGKLHNIIYAASLGLAAVAMALNKKAEAKVHLQKYLPLMKKYKVAISELILKCLLYAVENISKDFCGVQPLCLLNTLMQARQTMKIGDYRKALNFARRKGLLGLLHRWIVFFPDPVLHIIEKGKQTELPKTILKFPIFNQKIPVYYIRFLGKFIVFKNQQYLKTKLTPKEKAFLIQVALRAGEFNKTILVKDLFKNFWPKSENPSSLLSHLLVRLKRKVIIPGHLIGISTKYPNPVLVNRGVYLTTDHNNFEIALAQANLLQRAGEWRFAKREYLRAFAQFRGEPFKKMYDNWSQNMRSVILNQLETEATKFVKGCLEHKSKKDARKVLEKVAKIVPYSNEIKEISKTTI